MKKKVRVSLYSFLSLATCCLLLWTFEHSQHVDLPQPQQPASFYATQCRDDLRLVYETAIKEAKNSIEVTIFSFNDFHLFELLRDKANAGVRVTVIIDKKNGNSLRKYLGSNVIIVKRKTHGLMHRKLMVVDDHLVFAGSSNLTSESLWLHDNLVIGWDSENLAKIIRQKNSSQITDKPIVIKDHDMNIGGQHVEVWFLPEDKFALQKLLQLIHTAKKTIRVAMFTWTHMQLTDAIIEAEKRGVKVEVAVDARAAEGASQKVVQTLQLAGIRVGRNRGGQLLHHKFMYIDDTILVNGSANWTKAAFKYNEDVFFVIHDLNEVQKRFMQKLWDVVSTESQEKPPLLKAS
ncbi:MAG: phosphatidylserine/phosphatidylglycerophosphate/cardiolipin synthase family protein [Parachlamydiales bacterium]|nr:phosphatidylserine/phosphatidylglycerophosphate/cardiolipin synthase family protein [Parachlamydiales bacterium]